MWTSSRRSSREGEEHDDDDDENKKKGTTRMGKLIMDKSASFHIPSPDESSSSSPTLQLRRPKTDPNLLPFQKMIISKLLLNVNIQRSLGALKVVMSQESTVGDLIAAAVGRYAKEERRPFLPTTDPSRFDLHYSPFSLESLDRKERLISLGSRNFFLRPLDNAAAPPPSPSPSAGSSSSSSVTKTTTTSRPSCSNQVVVETMSSISTIEYPPWPSFTHFMM